MDKKWFCLPPLLIALIYLPALRGDFVYDDYQLIVEAPRPQSLAEVARVFGEAHCPQLPYYRPLAKGSLMLQKWWHGDWPMPYKLGNILILMMLCLAGLALLRLPAFALKPRFAMAAACLWALHPAVSSAAYANVSGRETLLAALFTILAVWAYCQPRRLWRLAALGFTAAALLSKESGLMAIPLLVFTDLCRVSAPPASGKRRLRYGYYAALAGLVLGYLGLRFWLFSGEEFQPASSQTLLLPLLSVVYALQAFLLPFWDLLYEPRWAVWQSWPRLAFLAVVCAAAAVLIWRRNLWPDRILGFWAAWFGLTLLPSANLLQQEVPFAERWLILPGLALIALAVRLVFPMFQVACEVPSAAKPAGRFALASLWLLAAGCAAVSVHRGSFWHSSHVFTRQWLAVDPSAHNAHAHSGYLDFQDGHFEAALIHFEGAIKYLPGNEEILLNKAYTLVALARRDEAQAHLRAALQTLPHSAEIRFALANLMLEESPGSEEVIGLLRWVVAADPAHAAAQKQLGHHLVAAGQYAQAVPHLQNALSADPNDDMLYASLAKSYWRTGQLEQAAKAYRRALGLAPEVAAYWGNLAAVVMQMGQLEQGASHLRKATQLEPQNAKAFFNLGSALFKLKQYEAAAAAFETCLKLQPDWPPAALRLSWILAVRPAAGQSGIERAARLAASLAVKTAHREAAVLDVLAAACARGGQFGQAAKWAERAQQIAQKQGKESLAAEIGNRLKLYRQHEPYVLAP